MPPFLFLTSFTLLVWMSVFVLMIVAHWFVFEKAGRPGWAILVPCYNVAVWFQVAGKPWWWLFLMLIPVANLVLYIIATAGVAKAFGRSGGFAVGLLFLPVVFYPILGFSKKIQYLPTPPAY